MLELAQERQQSMTNDEVTKLRADYQILKQQMYELDGRLHDIRRELEKVYEKMERIEGWFEEDGEELEPDAG